MRAHLISSCWYFLPSSTDLVTVMVLRERPKSQDKFPACHCRKWWSIRAGSFFENSKIPLTQLLFVQCSCGPLKSPTICRLSVDQQLADCCWREAALHNYHGFPVLVCLFESSVLQCILSQLSRILWNSKKNFGALLIRTKHTFKQNSFSLLLHSSESCYLSIANKTFSLITTFWSFPNLQFR